MNDDKVKRTYYLESDTVKALNNYVVTYYADPSTGSTYGAHSTVVNLAIELLMEDKRNPGGDNEWSTEFQ